VVMFYLLLRPSVKVGGRDTADGGRGIDECVGDPGDDLTNCEL
jgi:hypothetical protein